MVPSNAVLGLPNAGTVLKYNVVAQSVAGIQEMPAAEQTLTSTSITISGGLTTMIFTSSLSENTFTAGTASYLVMFYFNKHKKSR
jgi:hypothetical protein